MPKKLKINLLQIAMLTLVFSTALRLLELLQDLVLTKQLWKMKMLICGAAIVCLGLKFWQFYVGVYRDGTFFLDDDKR